MMKSTSKSTPNHTSGPTNSPSTPTADDDFSDALKRCMKHPTVVAALGTIMNICQRRKGSATSVKITKSLRKAMRKFRSRLLVCRGWSHAKTGYRQATNPKEQIGVVTYPPMHLPPDAFGSDRGMNSDFARFHINEARNAGLIVVFHDSYAGIYKS